MARGDGDNDARKEGSATSASTTASLAASAAAAADMRKSPPGSSGDEPRIKSGRGGASPKSSSTSSPSPAAKRERKKDGDSGGDLSRKGKVKGRSARDLGDDPLAPNQARVKEQPPLQQSSSSRQADNNQLLVFNTKENTEYKWQTVDAINDIHHGMEVIGSLEVPSLPDLDIRGEYEPHVVAGYESDFRAVMRIWEDWLLRDNFIAACDDIPRHTCCCGLVYDDDSTIKSMVPQLNLGWVRAINKKLYKANKPYQLDACLWAWHNAMGKAETNILLVRFFKDPDGGGGDRSTSQKMQLGMRVTKSEYKKSGSLWSIHDDSSNAGTLDMTTKSRKE